MNIEEIRNELRDGSSESLKRRRKVVFLSVLGLVDFGIISLYQTGVIRKLPDLPGKAFDSNSVNASLEAYMMGAPDGPISATVYGLNLIFASALGSEKTGRHQIFDVLLGATVAGNAMGAAYYVYSMASKQKVICPYCVTGAILNFAMLPFALPDAIKGFKNIFGSKKKEKTKDVKRRKLEEQLPVEELVAY